jgi:hypothetical protein
MIAISHAVKLLKYAADAPSFENFCVRHWQYRLSNDISIFAAEMTAIKTALELVKNMKGNKITIATDSLSSLRSIKSRHSNTNTNLLNKIFCTIAGLKANKKYSLDTKPYRYPRQ